MSEPLSKADAAKFIYRLLVTETEKARAAMIADQTQESGAREANRAFSQASSDDVGWGGGFTHNPPYSDQDITRFARHATRTSEVFEDWKNARDWYVEGVLEKYVK